MCRGKQEGGQVILAHQSASFFLAFGALFDGYGLGFSAESAKRGDGWRKRLITFGRVGQRGQCYANAGGEKSRSLGEWKTRYVDWQIDSGRVWVWKTWYPPPICAKLLILNDLASNS